MDIEDNKDEEINKSEQNKQLIPRYERLNYENKRIEFKKYLYIKNLNILKKEEQYWVNIANKLAGNGFNIEEYILNIELIEPLSVYFQFKNDIKPHIDKNFSEGYNKNKIYKYYWNKLDKKTRKKLSENFQNRSIQFDLNRLIIQKFLMLYYNPFYLEVSDPCEIFATTLLIYIKTNKLKNSEYCNKYVPLYKMSNYFENIFFEITDENHPLYKIKTQSISNYEYLKNLFKKEDKYDFEFLKDIKKPIDPSIKDIKEVTPLELFKNDLIKAGNEFFIQIYEDIFKRLDKNIIFLYTVKAKRINLLNHYRKILLKFH